MRLEGPYSAKALLGVGWADAIQGQYRRALVPWLELRKRNLLDAAVQESYLAVPYAFGKLQADGQAAEYYTSAIESFDAEMQRIDASIEQIRAGRLLDRLLDADAQKKVSWDWQLANLPDAPESRYLYVLLASSRFPGRPEELPRAQLHESQPARMAGQRRRLRPDTRDARARLRRAAAQGRCGDRGTDLEALSARRVEFESRLDEIEQTRDVAALGTPQEQAAWAHLLRLEEYMAAHPDEAVTDDMRDKFRLMKGVVYWRLSESFKARVGTSGARCASSRRRCRPRSSGRWPSARRGATSRRTPARLQFLKHIEENVPQKLEIHVVVDNYSTHKHAKVKRWLAAHERWHVHYTPTYASWLNQVEIWFNIITQKAIRRGTFRSVKELIAKIQEYVDRYNQHPKPFAWNATADSIFEKLSRLTQAISETAH